MAEDWQTARPKVSPKVKLDAKERFLTYLSRHQFGNQEPKGRRPQRARLGLTRRRPPAAVMGLDAGPSRSPRALTDVGTAETTGRDTPAERVSPEGQFEETVRVDLG